MVTLSKDRMVAEEEGSNRIAEIDSKDRVVEGKKRLETDSNPGELESNFKLKY